MKIPNFVEKHFKPSTLWKLATVILLVAVLYLAGAFGFLSRVLGVRAPKTVAALKELQSATRVGVERSDYLKLVKAVDMAWAEEQTSVSGTKFGQDLSVAVDDYDDAARMWTNNDDSHASL